MNEDAVRRPAGCDLYINLHPSDILDPQLFSASEPLLDISGSVVLEITERDAIQDPSGFRERLSYLRRTGFRIAVDDLGAGYSGLNYLALLEPDIVKIDMSLSRDVHRSATKLRLVQAVCSLCRDLDALVVAEGIECREEHEVMESVGCDLFQGYYFAKPGAPFPSVTWAA